MNDFASLNLDLLAENCKNETKKYLRNQPNETGYCFELFCRACRDGIQDAVASIHEIYFPLLTAKARKYHAFRDPSQNEDVLVNTALANFFLYTGGDKFLQMFPSLKRVIGYLYTCLNSEIVGDYRKHRNERPPDPNFSVPSPEAIIEARELWRRVEVLLKDEKELLFLVVLLYKQGMKVSEISVNYPQIWKTPREVSVARQRIRRRLSNDSDLRDLAGLNDDNPSDEDD